MKKIFNITIISMLALISVLYGCTGNFEEYNTNPKQPTAIPPENFLSKMFEVFAFPQQNNCQYLNCFWGCFSGWVTEVSTWEFGSQIFAYYNASEKHNGGTFGQTFGTLFPNFYEIEESSGGLGASYAVALIAKVWGMNRLVSVQGPVPYTQVKNGQLETPYDDEVTAWKAMFDDLDKAIDLLQQAGTENSGLASVDVIYNGDCTKWLKLANTLKLRMAIRFSGCSGMEEYAKQKAEESVIAGVMEDVTDSAWDNVSKRGVANGYAISWMQTETKANACIISYMNGYEDPRRAAYFTKYSDTWLGARSGPNELPNPTLYNDVSKVLISNSQLNPMPVMYAAEASFLRAEGALKGWSMGDEPETFYNKGVKLSFQEVSQNFTFAGSNILEQYSSYVNNDVRRPANYPGLNGKDACSNSSTVTVKWDERASQEIKLEKILTQKWIACYLDPLIGWSDFRRTGYPRIFPATHSTNAHITDLERGQRRIRFAENEYNRNRANVMKAIELLGGRDGEEVDLCWTRKN